MIRTKASYTAELSIKEDQQVFVDLFSQKEILRLDPDQGQLHPESHHLPFSQFGP
jgi:hypothetical protein